MVLMKFDSTRNKKKAPEEDGGGPVGEDVSVYIGEADWLDRGHNISEREGRGDYFLEIKSIASPQKTFKPRPITDVLYGQLAIVQT